MVSLSPDPLPLTPLPGTLLCRVNSWMVVLHHKARPAFFYPYPKPLFFVIDWLRFTVVNRALMFDAIVEQVRPPTCTVDRTIFELWLGGL